MFLNNHNLQNLAKWKYSVEDKSITTQYFTPLWKYLTDLVPYYIAPNLISFIGLLCNITSYYLCYYYLNHFPIIIPIISSLLIFTYIHLDAIDGMHARKTKNSSSMGELFDHACDNITLVFIVMTTTTILNITNPLSQWIIVQSAALVFMLNHLEAFNKGVVQFGRYNGPGEILMAVVLVIFGKTITSYSWFNTLINLIDETIIFKICYFLIYFYTLIKIISTKDHSITRNRLLLSIISRFVISMFYLNVNSLDTLTVISHGLIMTVITSDLIVSKMSRKELSYIVPIFVIIGILHNFLDITLCLVYHIVTLLHISYSLNIPIFTVKRNVFCNGVYDLLHIGHMNLFEKAASYGNRLIVGVHNDSDVASYKRVPYMTHEERCQTVSKCKYVDEVIHNCPLILTEEFIKEHNIHVVVCSPEYDTPEDKYYKIAREQGILHVLPRTETISTSELIKRIKDN